MSCKGKVEFVELGVMGYPMAGHLAKNGYDVTVFNRTNARADQWVMDLDGEMAASPAGAAINADFIFTCVGNDDDLRSVVLGDDGIFAGMKGDACLVDHTTTSASSRGNCTRLQRRRVLVFSTGIRRPGRRRKRRAYSDGRRRR